MIRTLMIIVWLSVLILNSCACGKAQESALTPLTLRLQWFIQTQFAGYYVALKKGYYSDQGLDVTIKEGSLGKNNLLTVSEGLEEFGNRTFFDLMPKADRIVILANILKEDGMVLVSKKQLGIKTVFDLIGRRISIWFNGHEAQLFGLLAKHQIDPSQVELIAQNFGIEQFIRDQVDVYSAMVYNELPAIRNSGYSDQTLSIINPVDYGVSLLGDSLFTSKEFFKKNPKICQKFVDASIRGWQYSIRYPDEATRIVLEYDERKKLNFDEQRGQLVKIISLLHAEKWPIGAINQEITSNTLCFARELGHLDAALPNDSLFWTRNSNENAN